MKIFSFIVTVWAVLTVTFFMMKAIPGDPFSDEKILAEGVKEALYRYHNLDAPLWKQYLNFLKNIASGDLGTSLKYQGFSVNEMIKKGFPISATLGFEALFLAFGVGVILGTWKSRTSLFFVVLCISIPSFILATLLQYFLAYKLKLLPVARWGTFQQTILPALALAAYPAAFITRLIRVQMSEVLKQDYILTAKAKKIPKRVIFFKHALRNALLPLFPYLGPLIANILVGSFVVEQIFAIPGLGKWFVLSVSNRDYPVILGTTVFYTLTLLTLSSIMDFFHTLLDPRRR